MPDSRWTRPPEAGRGDRAAVIKGGAVQRHIGKSKSHDGSPCCRSTSSWKTGDYSTNGQEVWFVPMKFKTVRKAFRTALVLIVAVGVAACQPRQDEQAGTARNVILFVGDGMGVATVTAARISSTVRAGLHHLKPSSGVDILFWCSLNLAEF